MNDKGRHIIRVDELTDLHMTLDELASVIGRLIEQHGWDAVLSADAGANNVIFELLVKE